MRKLAFILFWGMTVGLAFAGPTNYFCVVCGQGPLTGQVWISKWGAVCDACYKLPDHCSICGLPVKDGDGHIKTPDGRFICRFDKTNAVLTLDQAKDLFTQTRDDVVELYGQQFALKYPDVTVSLFDVDYWSEKQGESGLHKFGFSHTRKTADGQCTHEVVMLSGRTREEMMSVAAHEYTHLWINENRPDSHVIDGDTVEAICELTAYKLMGDKKLPDLQQRILENPYTNGKIKTLVAVEREGGTDYVLNWVKTGTTTTFDDDENLPSLAAPAAAPVYFGPRILSQGLKFSGIMAFGSQRQAVINGVAFVAGEQKTLKLRDRSVPVRCREIHDQAVVVELDGSTNALTLARGVEKLLP